MTECCSSLNDATDSNCNDCLHKLENTDNQAVTYAVSKGNYTALRILISRFPNESSPRGWTPLMQAVDD